MNEKRRTVAEGGVADLGEVSDLKRVEKGIGRGGKKILMMKRLGVKRANDAEKEIPREAREGDE